MFEVLKLYFMTLVNPWNKNQDERKISYFEVLGISWALHFVYTFYSVFAIYLGVQAYDYFSTSKDFTHLMLNSFSFSFQKISLFVQLGTVILYPLAFHFSYKFWIYLLNFYTQIFSSNEEQKDNVTDIVNSMYTSNIFLVLPIIGALLSFFAQVLILYGGVSKKLNFTKTQAFLVLLTPLFLVFIIAILIVSYLVFLVSLF